MKVKDLLNITYPYTEITIYDEGIMQGDFYASTKQVNDRYMKRTIDQVSTNEHGTLEILLKKIQESYEKRLTNTLKYAIIYL